MSNNLSNTNLSFIGCGVMAESMIAGLLRKKMVAPEQIAASHPRANRRATWYLLRSTAGFTGVRFGNNEDKPIPNAFVP